MNSIYSTERNQPQTSPRSIWRDKDERGDEISDLSRQMHAEDS